MTNIIEQLEAEQMTRKIPKFGPGDTELGDTLQSISFK